MTTNGESADRRELAERYARFARGFYASLVKPTFVPEGWSEFLMGQRVFVGHDPRVPVVSETRNGHEVATIGECYLVDEPSATNAQVTQRLAEAYSRSEADFLTLLDRTHGRYAIVTLDARKDGPEVFHDATGMRSVYFYEGGGLVASHPALVARSLALGTLPPTVRGYGSPGLSTPYEDVSLLPPNHSLRLRDARMTRFWPRRKIGEQPTSRVSEKAAEILDSTLVGIAARHPVILASLTAGTDSRLTLACALRTRLVGQMEFFTYHWDNKKWIDEADKRVSQEIAGAFELSHSLVNLKSEDEPSKEAISLLADNAYRVHSRTLAVAYFRLYSGRDLVHLRSNMSEIVRTFYLKKRTTPRPKNGRDLAEIYKRSISMGQEPTPEVWSRAVSEFEKMYRRTEFARASKYVDGRDLMYWEHRMGSWHTQVVLESDWAFDTLSLYNSRALLELMLSAPIEDRMDDKHMRQIIGMGDSRLLEFKFNPGPRRVKSDRDGSVVLAEEKAERRPRLWRGRHSA